MSYSLPATRDMPCYRCAILALYAVYLSLNFAAFILALADEQRVFSLVVPVVTGGLHSLSLLVHIADFYLGRQRFGRVWPMGVEHCYIAIDTAVLLVVCLGILALAGALASQLIAWLSALVLIVASLACFLKAYLL